MSRRGRCGTESKALCKSKNVAQTHIISDCHFGFRSFFPIESALLSLTHFWFSLLYDKYKNQINNYKCDAPRFYYKWKKEIWSGSERKRRER